MTESAEAITTERLVAALRLDAGRPLVAVYGPGVVDEFVGRDYTVRDVEAELWEHLHAAGFQRVAFSILGLPIYFRDRDSLAISSPPRRPGSRPRRGTFKHFGALSRLNTEERWEPAARRDPGAAVRATAEGPGGPPVIDEAAIQQLDVWMNDPRCRTALVIVHAEDWFTYLNSSSNLARVFSNWISAGHANANLCLLLLKASSAGEVADFADSLGRRPVPALSSYLSASRAATNQSWDSPFVRVGHAEAAEIERLLQIVRLKHRIHLDWDETRRLAVAMAAEEKPVAQWFRQFPHFPQERPLNGQTLRDLGWLKGAVADGRSARERLDAMIGLHTVKRHLRVLEVIAKDEVARRAAGKVIHAEPASLHLLFRGNPGTGKTVVAGLIGELYRDLGLLRRGHVHAVRVSDIVGQYVGHTPARMNEAIDRALDGVLFIDEAYRLTNESADAFSRQAVDTLLDRMENERHRLVVIVAGYSDEMEQFLASNPGLPRRFPERNRITFPDYEPAELHAILLGYLQAKGIAMTPEMQEHLLHVTTGIHRVRKREFGNAGAMREFAEELAANRAVRIDEGDFEPDESLRTDDLSEPYRVHLEQAPPEIADLLGELDHLVGLEPVKEAIRDLVARLQLRQRRRTGAKPIAPHLLFAGPPGTGKTTVARLMGRIYRALGLLTSGHVVEVNRSDLVGQFVGQSERRTMDRIEAAMDGVLFIDEIYALASPGQTDFGSVVIDTLNPQMENRRGRLAVIAAGYAERMATFLSMNQGLASRFTQQIDFPSYTEPELIAILEEMAAREGYDLLAEVAAAAGRVLLAERDRNPTVFGNARSVRGLLERMEARLARRTMHLPADADPAVINRFVPEDVV